MPGAGGGGGLKKQFGPRAPLTPSEMFLLDFTMPRARVVDCLSQFLVFCPRVFDDKSRVQCPAHFFDENQKLAPL
jgi:hypothetical protein